MELKIFRTPLIGKTVLPFCVKYAILILHFCGKRERREAVQWNLSMTPLPGGSGKPPDGEHFPTRCCFPAAGTGSPPRSTLLRPWSVRAADKALRTCPACRKVFSGIHPDVITVRDEAHKNLSVDTVRQIRADAYIRPNEGARKVYIFPDCTILTEQDQNVLLKIVEEGPPYAAFLFCAENSSVVLQTLRSRCVELKLHPAVTVEKESSEAGVELCRLLAAGKRGLSQS